MKIIGNIKLKGDKSISHRALMVAALCPGISTLINLPKSMDVNSTINCLKKCGIIVRKILQLIKKMR